MDFEDFPRCLGKSGCESHPPPQDMSRPTTDGGRRRVHGTMCLHRSVVDMNCETFPVSRNRSSKSHFNDFIDADPGTRLKRSLTEEKCSRAETQRLLEDAQRAQEVTHRDADEHFANRRAIPRNRRLSAHLERHGERVYDTF